jgi:DNA replication and repair protein RecF
MISDLRLRNFRSYSDESFEFGKGINVIVGPNASGKTNLLEALLVISKGSSYRAKENELVKFDEEWARLDVHLYNGDTRTLKITPNKQPSKLYEIDGKSYQRLSFERSIPVVLFEPDHLRLLSGGPERRRNYIDDLIEQTTTGFAGLRRQYKRALIQRNTLLKNVGINLEKQLFPWNVRLSELAGQIVRARVQILEEIDGITGLLYKTLSSSKTNLKIAYNNQWKVDSYESDLLKKLEASIGLDQSRGFTVYGPHREDVIVLFDKHPIQEVASRGETRTAVLALKIAELKLVEESRNVAPLLLLDDVFSELDGSRRHALMDILLSHQTFITTPDPEIALGQLAGKCEIIAL